LPYIAVISIAVVDYLIERLKKVSPKVSSVLIVPFVPDGQQLVPRPYKRSPGQTFRYTSLARYRDLGLLHDELEEGQATR